MARAKTSARTPMRGRTKFALALVGFLVVAVIVVWRRTEGTALANRARELRAQIGRLESERDALQHDLREAASRKRVVSEAERRLGLHVAGDLQTRTIAEADSVP